MKRGNSLEEEIKLIAKKFLEESKNIEIQIISHFDTDEITSATIMIQTLKKMDRKFSVKIVKNLEKDFIYSLPKNKITFFLDLASGNLNHIEDSGLKDVFIIDHHEVIQDIPEGISIINPELHDNQKISSSCLTYLFCNQISTKNKELAKLAILGMIGDTLEKEVDKLNKGILDDGEITRKRGLLIYPSTRPLNRTLEFCSNPYIPKVTGNTEGVTELLREAGLNPEKGKYKSIMELNPEEMEKVVTAIMLRNPKAKYKDIIGDIFLIKFFNKLEDARELSAIINACSRMGESETAIQFCMEIPKAKKRAELIHTKYKQLLISGLKFITKAEKINGKDFVIINAKDQIKDTIIGTITSILSWSPLYEDGTIIVAMAYCENSENKRFSVLRNSDTFILSKNQQEISGKIKVSARNVGRQGRNVREPLNSVIKLIGGEVGGHKFAAGCLISKDKEQEFINLLKKSLEVEVVRI